MNLNNKQRRTLEAIFERPTRANIAWTDVEKLFIALGGEIINKGGSIINVLLDGQPRIFHRPHPQKEAKKYTIDAVRTYLTILGYEP
ncbi:MAG: type II toxin-antitoxin system HicA family toxin [Rickettsiales bacterium]